MIILAEESVRRYHVEFDEEETLLLKAIGFLPGSAHGHARLWLTFAKIETAKEMLAKAKEAKDRK